LLRVIENYEILSTCDLAERFELVHKEGLEQLYSYIKKYSFDKDILKLLDFLKKPLKKNKERNRAIDLLLTRWIISFRNPKDLTFLGILKNIYVVHRLEDYNILDTITIESYEQVIKFILQDTKFIEAFNEINNIHRTNDKVSVEETQAEIIKFVTNLEEKLRVIYVNKH
jgi:hypothetical protein